MQQEQDSNSTSPSRLLVLVTEQEYSQLVEKDLQQNGSWTIVGLLIIQEEKYFIIMVLQALKVLINLDFSHILELLQVKIQYDLDKYFIGPQAASFLK